MCRIAGLVRPGRGLMEPDILRMRDAMQRGGPDDAGVYISEKHHLALGHRRLAVIDLTSAGHQPMSDPEHDLVLAYNGELYNFPALREELRQLGHVFRTSTDTEVILKSYAAWGSDCFRRFNGMFALVLLDCRRRQLLLARDHAGIKPLYYCQQGDQLYFASEIRAFRALDSQWPENPHWRALFLTFGHLPEPVTTLHAVQALPKNHYFQYDLDTHTGNLQRYAAWHIQPEIFDRREALQQVRSTMEQAVERQLLSDAPIGLFLSGGVDSSILAIAAQAHLGARLRTTSIVFEEEKYSEKPYQDIIIRATGAQHTAITLRQSDFEAAFDDALAAMDQPTNDGINTYFVSRAAHAAGLTVALSGLGADELFGGYPSFDYGLYARALRHLPNRLLMAGAHLAGDRWKKINFLTLPGMTGEYLFYRGLFAPREVARLTGETEQSVIDQLRALPANQPNEALEGGNRVSWIETNYYMQNQLLKDTDAMSMWHSLEVRVPFLDRAVMDLAGRIAPELKFGPKRKKYLLIQAFPELPQAIWDRPKQGFTFPFRDWFQTSERMKGAGAVIQPFRERFLQGKLSWGRLWVAYLSQKW